MALLGILRYSVQLLALAIFAYQMIVAFDKYFSNGQIQSVETKSIGDISLPDIFICLSKDEMYDQDTNRFYYGYPSYDHYLFGNIYGSYQPSFVSWMENGEVSFENMTRKLFGKIDTDEWFVYGNPAENWRVEPGRVFY